MTNHELNILKMKKIINDWFKVFIAIILLIFLYLIYNLSQNGRYQFSNNSNQKVLDTRTGKVYRVGKNNELK